ncbi:methyl-accepting chemotaxis protein [Xenococcus sp. PCC 7305]|uniref:methyl-accepting chemotaxis protein n=1 Tax=Xenococcus sp. PCC 7305 TaxID=102125 RepID=UPI0002ACC826|nr:methyl-accepting chemotaxis protein [Xenococcus sp. PCC 7305]ELS03838.1 methyl-accepting chemotaxis protein [Xenococcus sp. PCC 7305]
MKKSVTNPQLEANNTISQQFQKKNTLRNRLLITILPAVLMPLAIASAIGYSITESRMETQALSELEKNTLLTGKTTTTFIKDSFKIPNLVAVNPLVIEAMRAGTQKAQTQGLPKQSIEAVEQQFADTKLLEVDKTLNQYLEQVVQSTSSVEIFFTERNGFNIAFSNATSDFVQRDEGWWQNSQKNGQAVDEPEFDDSANAVVVAISKAVTDPQTGDFLGVIKTGIPVTELDSNIATYLSAGLKESQTVQVVDSEAGSLMTTINSDGSDPENQEVIGGETIFNVAKTLRDSAQSSNSDLAQLKQLLQEEGNFDNISIQQKEFFSEISMVAQLEYQGKVFSFSTIPNTDLVAIAAVNSAEIAAAGRNLLTVFALTAIILGSASLFLIILLARQLSKPLTELSEKTQQVAEGNLDVQAELQGTIETMTLAYSFNSLVKQVKDLLENQKEQVVADEQRQQKEKLEQDIYGLIDEVSDALEGDLTVRASLDSMELSTVADIFNAIIDNLQEIAIEAKQSTGQVGSSLKANESAIRLLAEQAIAEAQETRATLTSVEQMSQSIQEVAANAGQAEKIADDTYNTVQQSSSDMEKTVDSIINLRTTVGETAKKMKRLGESSQKISQVVSFIEEIALKTNVLAINASVEAGRAGEQGHGFTIVAEQVGALAAQSAAATKEIASIVAAIQRETQEVSQAMESGTSQVVESTRLVESTKQSLGLVLEKSQDINQLMRSISQKTISQTTTSQTVTNLMQQIAELSEKSSKSSKEIVQSMVETAQVAQNLESTVAKFKVNSDSD